MSRALLAVLAASVVLLFVGFSVICGRRERIMKAFIVSQAAEIRRLRNRLNGMSGFQDSLIQDKTACLQAQVSMLERKLYSKDKMNHRLYKSLRRNGGSHEQGRIDLGVGA